MRLVNAAPNIDLVGLELTPATVVEGEEGNGMWPFYLQSRWLQCHCYHVVPTLTRSAHRITVLSHIISQLKPGADLSRVVLPTFILEPRSMLERITKYKPGCWLRSCRLIGTPASWHTLKSCFLFLILMILFSDSFKSSRYI